MARKLTCNNCSGIKEAGYENDSCCRKCRSEINKAKRVQAMLDKGKRPYGSGRNPNCTKCGKEKTPTEFNESQCNACRREPRNKRLMEKRRAMGIGPRKEGPSLTCRCGKLKERPEARECNDCHRERDKVWRIKTGRSLKNRTGKCACGNEFAPYSKCYCKECNSVKRREYLDSRPDLKERLMRASMARRKETYISRSKGRIRRKGTLINGVPVLCSECDKLTEGWCKTCDLIYWWRKEQYKSDPEYADKIKIRALTRSYIRSGRLARMPCEICGLVDPVEAHHDDYLKPLDVRWLCKKHHAEHHKNEKNLGD